MIYRIFFLFFYLAFSQTYSQAQALNCKNGKVAFKSDAPLELISAQSKELRGIIDPNLQVFGFSIRTESFLGFNSVLQREHFNENYMESPKYKASTFEGKFIDYVDFKKNGIYCVKVKGKLKIHGIEKERIIKVDLDIKNNQIFIKSKFSVLLVDHNISIPKIVFQKIAEEIFISIDATLMK